MFRRQEEVCPECGEGRKKCFVAGAQWVGSSLAFCLALPWWVDRVGAGVPSCGVLQAVQVSEPLWVTLAGWIQSCELRGLIYVQSSWWRLAILPLLMCWLLVVDIHRYGGEVRLCSHCKWPFTGTSYGSARSGASVDLQYTASSSELVFSYLQVYVESQSAVH